MAREVQLVKIAADEEGTRLDRFLARQNPSNPLGFMTCQTLIRKGEVRVNGKRSRGDYRLVSGDEVRLPPLHSDGKGKIPLPSLPAPHIQTELKKLADKLAKSIFFSNQDVIAIHKPAGLAVQGGSGLSLHVNGVLPELATLTQSDCLRLVHRLDKDTSGVLLLARHRQAAHLLTRAFAERQIVKEYMALCLNAPPRDDGEIDMALAKSVGGSFGREASRPTELEDGGKRAITDYHVVERAGGNVMSLILAKPRTGRNHQIRAHLAAIGCPIVGDGKYGGREAYQAMQATSRRNLLHLHAWAVTLPPALEDAGLRLVAPLPIAFQASLKELGFELPHPNLGYDSSTSSKPSRIRNNHA